MASLFITATNTNVGKTHTTLTLIKEFASLGLKVGVYKPIETGVTTTPPDATTLLETCQRYNPAFGSLTPDDITAYTFALPAAPFCADTERTITIERIERRYHELANLCDILLVEGAGGLLVPITQTHTIADLIQILQTPTLLVTPSRLGCINETLLSLEALNARSIDYEWCVNLHEDKESFPTVTQPYYDTHFPEWWSLQEGVEAFCRRLLALYITAPTKYLKL